DPGPSEQRRRVDARELLVVDRDLQDRRRAPAVLDRPVDPDPASRVQGPVPRTERVRLVRCGREFDSDRGWVLGQPGAELLVAHLVWRHRSPPRDGPERPRKKRYSPRSKARTPPRASGGTHDRRRLLERRPLPR